MCFAKSHMGCAWRSSAELTVEPGSIMPDYGKDRKCSFGEHHPLLSTFRLRWWCCFTYSHRYSLIHDLICPSLMTSLICTDPEPGSLVFSCQGKGYFRTLVESNNASHDHKVHRRNDLNEANETVGKYTAVTLVQGT